MKFINYLCIGTISILSYILTFNDCKQDNQDRLTEETSITKIEEPQTITSSKTQNHIVEKTRFPLRFVPIKRPTMGDFLDNAKRNYKQVPRLIQEIKKYGIVPLDYPGDLEVDIANLINKYEKEMQKQAETNPLSALELEIFQTTNSLGDKYYPPKQFYTELIYLLSSTKPQQPEHVKRLLNLALGYARYEALPPRELQLPLLFSISHLKYTPRELKEIIIIPNSF